MRWTFTQGADIWTMPINPDTMTSPHQDRTIQTGYGKGGGANRLWTFVTPSAAKEWSFGGVIRTQAHYEALELWAKKSGKVRITDHLGRTFEVFIQAFEPEDRRPNAKVSWRLRYQMKTLLLRRIS